MAGILYVLGTLLLLLGAYVGLALDGFVSFPLEAFGGLAGLLPVILGIVGTLFWALAHRIVVEHRKSIPTPP